jgi:hypothetical protein
MDLRTRRADCVAPTAPQALNRDGSEDRAARAPNVAPRFGSGVIPEHWRRSVVRCKRVAVLSCDALGLSAGQPVAVVELFGR